LHGRKILVLDEKLMPNGRTVIWGKWVLVVLAICGGLPEDFCRPVPSTPTHAYLSGMPPQKGDTDRRVGVLHIPVDRDVASTSSDSVIIMTRTTGNESEVKTSELSDGAIKGEFNDLLKLRRGRRAAKLAHISGTSRKIQIFIKKHFLQIFPDGTVNGTQDDMSEYSECPITAYGGLFFVWIISKCVFFIIIIWFGFSLLVCKLR
jgi:hypothetical protein